MRIKAKTKECRLLVKVKTSFRESFDTKEVDRFARVFLRCFLKPQILKPNILEYSGPVGISLQDRMKKEITKRDFLFILEHIVVAVQKLNGNKFPLYNLRMDMQYIFINENTKELQFLYIPLIGANEGSNIIDLFNAVIYSAHPAPEKDTEYVSRFNYFFKSLKPFDINKVEQFIQREDRTVVNTIKKHNAGQSGFMTSDHKHYYDHLDEQKKKRDEEDTDLLEDEERTDLLTDDDPTGLLVDDDPTGLLTDDDATGLLTVTGDEATGFLDEDEEKTGLLTSEDESTGLLIDEEDKGTALLDETLQPKQTVAFPELHRILTGEVIKINKPVFRIGKERSYVDYFVTNNNAISRSHADIITRESGYFVIDLNSKNGTYINNVPLAIQEETRISDGDILRLGNEEFEFHVGSAVATLPVCPNCKAQVKASSNFCAFCGCKL